MPHLHLPSEHTEHDLVLAHRVAQAVDSAELFVVWNHRDGGGRRPEVRAYVQQPASPIVEAIAHVVAWIGTLLEAVVPARRAPEPAAQPREGVPAQARL